MTSPAAFVNQSWEIVLPRLIYLAATQAVCFSHTALKSETDLLVPFSSKELLRKLGLQAVPHECIIGLSVIYIHFISYKPLISTTSGLPGHEKYAGGG